MRYIIAAAAILTFTSPIMAQGNAGHHAEAKHTANPALEAAIANPNRGDDQMRDIYRHPAETLTFFQITPDMTVGEYAPGGGWYSRVLANYLSKDGSLVGLYTTPVEGLFDEASRQRLRDGAAAFPAQVAEWTGRPAEQTQGITLDKVDENNKGTLDRILVIRGMHNLMRRNIADHELKAMRDLLKTGGMLGIVQHRAKPGALGDYTDGSKGYLREKDLIGFVEAMGFELVGQSEINANPKDPANHPRGVWEMKPVWATKNPELENLGESDRMTLLFRKR